MKNIKVIIFDHDDTLVDTFGTKSAEHTFIAKKYFGRTITDKDIRKAWNSSLENVMKELYGTDDVKKAIEVNKRHHTEFPKKVFKFTKETLKELKKRGYKLGLATSTIAFSLEHDFETLDIDKSLFDYVQTQTDSPFTKPDPRFFDPMLRWLESLGVEPGEALYVGDGLHDFEAADRAGLQFVGVETGVRSSEEFANVGAKSIPNISHILDFITH